jgi:hypothetical protein
MTTSETKSQVVYPVSSGEIIFSFADVERNGVNVPTNMRFTVFFNYGQYWHFDIGNNVGFYTGGAIRNVGFITDEDNFKVKRRSYTLGVPLALKLGSFGDNFYIFGGGEYEWLFHYKQKIFQNDNKIKRTEWLSDRTARFLPSLFAGIQFPKGLNIKFKYYLDEFLNRDFTGTDLGEPVDYSEFNQTQIFYVSVSFQLKGKKYREEYKAKSFEVAEY